MTIGRPVQQGRCRLEFLIEPFMEGNPGPHVLSSLEVLRNAGMEVVLGPFGNTAEGEEETLTSLLPMIVQSAFEKGASRILLNLTKPDARRTATSDRAVHPTSSAQDEALAGGSAVVDPMTWKEAVIDPSRREDLHGAVERIVNAVETQMGGALGDLTREKKQAAVRILDEQGVFLIRKSVETVAKAMGVSRITIYNYLNAIRGD